MNGTKRRERVLKVLEDKTQPITGSELSVVFNVSRQIIVQDIALLRAQGEKIISTANGYLIYKIKTSTCKRVFCVQHEDSAIEDELLTIVDNGGHVLNIIVSHVVYGEISVDLLLGSRRQVKDFMVKTRENEFVPLMVLTKGEHYHTVEANTEEILDEIEEELREKGYLVQN